jgi:hypothetical protein
MTITYCNVEMIRFDGFNKTFVGDVTFHIADERLKQPQSIPGQKIELRVSILGDGDTPFSEVREAIFSEATTMLAFAVEYCRGKNLKEASSGNVDFFAAANEPDPD